MEPQRLNIPQEKLIPTSQITQGEFLGQGGYGQVYKCKWNNKTVAVKRLILEKMNPEAQKEFEKEIALHLKLSHPCVIRLYGIIAEANKPYGMVMKYAAKGSLFDLLHKTDQPEFEWGKRKQIALDISHGLDYLHRNNIIHRDLKSLNILISKTYQAQLADFGLSKVRSQTSSQSKFQIKGTLHYLAPELLSGFGKKYNSQTDIYAYGITLWELATHKIPYDETNSELIISLVKEGQREEFPDEMNIPQKYQELTELCWAQKPNDRPTIENIQKLLNKMDFGKSKSHSSNRTNTNSIRNNSYALDSDVQSKQNNNGYVLESQTVKPKSKSTQKGGTLKTKTVISKSQNSIQTKQNDIEAIYKLAFQHIKQSEFSKAVPLLENAVEKGHAGAHYHLGVCYQYGLGVTQNPKKALKYFQKAVPLLENAAEQGHAGAQHDLGLCYNHGHGVTQDPKKAMKYFQLGAAQKNIDAQYELGQCYRNISTLDYPQAAKYFRLAADQGHALAQVILGSFYRDGMGVKQDYTQAVKYYRLAADQGLAIAQYNLGSSYYYGNGITQDYTQAIKHFHLAADQGYYEAQLELGNCYRNGHGVNQDYGQAVKYFRLAADQGDPSGQLNLGICYHEGKGVTKDINQAKHYYQLAANQGFSSAVEVLRALNGQ